MWTSDIIYALKRFEEDFGNGNTVCIEDMKTGMFGCLIIRYCGHHYIFVAKEDKWVKKEG